MVNVKNAVPAVIAAASLTLASAAHAALPEEIGTGLTAIQTDALALIDLVWPVVIAITTGFILFKLFKRGANKV